MDLTPLATILGMGNCPESKFIGARETLGSDIDRRIENEMGSDYDENEYWTDFANQVIGADSKLGFRSGDYDGYSD